MLRAQEEKLGLLRAHPDLAGKAALAGSLTCESTEEQARAGLGSLTPEELARFTEMNNAYREKFDFPFILAVRNARKARPRYTHAHSGAWRGWRALCS